MKEYKTVTINTTDSEEILIQMSVMEKDGWTNIGGEPIKDVTTRVVGVRRFFERDTKEEEEEEEAIEQIGTWGIE